MTTGKLLQCRIVWLLVLCFQGLRLGLAQENCRVRSIEFAGNETISEDDLLKQIELYGTGWFSENILQKDPFIFSSKAVDSDLQALKAFYQSEGFFHVKIGKPRLDADDEGRTVDVAITVEEGAPVVVDSVRSTFVATGDQEGPDLDSIWQTVASSLRLLKPARFRDELVNGDQGTIIRTFLARGYPFVSVRNDLDVDTIENTVRITWVIDPGRGARFGDVRFLGDTRVARSLLDNRIAFTPGSTFDQTRLEQTQEEIYGLSLFRAVNVRALLEDSADGRVPVEVVLQDAVPFRTRFGIGYGKEEKFRILAQLTWLGVLGGPGKLDLEVKHSALELYSVSGKYTHPDFLFPKLILTLYPYTRREIEPAYTNRRLGLSTSLEKKFFRAALLSLTQTIERVEVDPGSISPVNREGNFLETYPKSSISLGIIRNTGRPLMDPKDGSSESFVVTYSGLGLGSPYRFLKVIPDLRRYDRLTGSLVLATRLKMGGIQSYNEDGYVPLEERFYAGGATSVRGWGRQLLGPLDDQGKPIGGKSLLEGSIEGRFPVIGIFGGVLFMDFGNVWQESFTYRIRELRCAAGAGVRLETPIGPIRFDLAIPVFEGKQQVSFFFSIGQAF